MSKNMYAVYQGDDFEYMGTSEEVAKREGITTNALFARVSRGIVNPLGREIIKVPDIEDEEELDA